MMVREGFHILTQGVEMTHYEVHKGFRKTYSNELKIVWLNPDSLRICVTKNRPPVVQNQVYPGVYLRDVVEIVGGAHTYAFATRPEPPENEETCLNIIASECTLCLQLPSEVCIFYRESFVLLVTLKLWVHVVFSKLVFGAHPFAV